MQVIHKSFLVAFFVYGSASASLLSVRQSSYPACASVCINNIPSGDPCTSGPIGFMINCILEQCDTLATVVQADQAVVANCPGQAIATPASDAALSSIRAVYTQSRSLTTAQSATAIATTQSAPIQSTTQPVVVITTFTGTANVAWATATPIFDAGNAPSSSHSNTGAIVGGVIGGLIGLAALIGIILVMMREKKTSTQATATGPPVIIVQLPAENHRDIEKKEGKDGWPVIEERVESPIAPPPAYHN